MNKHELCERLRSGSNGTFTANTRQWVDCTNIGKTAREWSWSVAGQVLDSPRVLSTTHID